MEAKWRKKERRSNTYDEEKRHDQESKAQDAENIRSQEKSQSNKKITRHTPPWLGAETFGDLHVIYNHEKANRGNAKKV